MCSYALKCKKKIYGGVDHEVEKRSFSLLVNESEAVELALKRAARGQKCPHIFTLLLTLLRGFGPIFRGDL